MTFTKGWLGDQITTANDTILKWTDAKREVMVREDLCPVNCSGVKTEGDADEGETRR